MSLTSSFSVSRVRNTAIAGLAVLAGAGVIGAGSAHAATAPASTAIYQQAPSTFMTAGISAPIQSVGGVTQDPGSGDQSQDPSICFQFPWLCDSQVILFQGPPRLI
jgi:hypothetical protein